MKKDETDCLHLNFKTKMFCNEYITDKHLQLHSVLKGGSLGIMSIEKIQKIYVHIQFVYS